MAKKPMSRARKTGIVFTIIGVSIVGLSFLGWAGSNAVVGIRDHTYYQNRVKYRPCPGINDPYTPTGLAYDAKGDFVMTAGKMDNPKLASRVYCRDAKGKENHCSLYQSEEKPLLSEITGLTTYGNQLYAAHDGIIGIFDIPTLVSEETAVETLTFTTAVHADSLAADGTYLYVGECWEDAASFSSHEYTNADGVKTHALGAVYTLGTGILQETYTLPDHTKGFLKMSSGEVVVSVENGDWCTEYRIYSFGKDRVSSKTWEGAPVYELDQKHLVSSFTGPSGGRDIEAIDGRVLTFSSGTGFKRLFQRMLFYQDIDGLLI